MENCLDFLKGFIIGVIEGEGSIFRVNVHIHPNCSGGQIVIVNTDKCLIDTIATALQKLGIGCRVREHNSRQATEKRAQGKMWKQAYRIVITHRLDFEKILSFYDIENSWKKDRLKEILSLYKRKTYKRRVQT